MPKRKDKEKISEPKYSHEDHSMLLQRRSTSAPSIVVVIATHRVQN